MLPPEKEGVKDCNMTQIRFGTTVEGAIVATEVEKGEDRKSIVQN